MPILEGLEDAGREIGRQEKAIGRFVAKYREEHPEMSYDRELVLDSLPSLGENIDAQNRKGREISRNMATLLDFVRTLHEWDDSDTAPELPDETRELLKGMSL